MKKSNSYKLLIASAFVCIFFAAATESHAQNYIPWPVDKVVGESAPDFTLKDMSGKDVTLSSFKGKPVLLNFWATWCPYCRQERSHLKTLYEEYKGKDLVIISVSIDRSTRTIKNFMEQNPAPYIVLTDTEGAAAVPYNVMSLPTTYLIDRNGKISRKFMGMVKWSEKNAKDVVDNLVKQQ
ncbi:MAG: TlpA family protein disulfide reductase [Nitrospiraceae bacterium]|nr:MAG: TlpA family protein disulfide reductase [Nitrospiraceae bacterium]